MKRLPTFITILILASLTLAYTCPEQTYPPIPPGYGIDPNEIAGDPPLLLGVVVTVVGRSVKMEGWACDPDGDAFNIISSAGSLSTIADPNGLMLYEIQYVPTSAGVHYIHVSAVDEWGAERTGTHVVSARTNVPPTLCGGRL